MNFSYGKLKGIHLFIACKQKKYQVLNHCAEKPLPKNEIFLCVCEIRHYTEQRSKAFFLIRLHFGSRDVPL